MLIQDRTYLPRARSSSWKARFISPLLIQMFVNPGLRALETCNVRICLISVDRTRGDGHNWVLIIGRAPNLGNRCIGSAQIAVGT